VLWGGEFGYTPASQGDDGRDHITANIKVKNNQM
jgi:hypothetical protein